jgi:hypothetical protein
VSAEASEAGMGDGIVVRSGLENQENTVSTHTKMRQLPVLEQVFERECLEVVGDMFGHAATLGTRPLRGPG